MSDDADIQAAAERLDNAEQPKKPDPDGLTVDQAAAKLREMQGAAAEVENPGVELPEPELSPMSDDEIETWASRETHRELENYRLSLANEQKRLAEQEEEIKALREYDPAEFSARTWEHRAQVDAFNAALQQYTNTLKGYQSEAEKKEQRHLLNEQEQLKAKIPGWDNAKREKLVRYLMRAGYSRDQINAVSDHKIIVAFYQQMERIC